MGEKQNKGRGWHGDSAGHQKAGQIGGERTAEKYGPEFYEEIGRKGGKASPGKFEKGSPRAKEAGRKGGRARGESDN